jgi:isochorismatase family protein
MSKVVPQDVGGLGLPDPVAQRRELGQPRRDLPEPVADDEGCILHTTLGALRRDYRVSLVVDATAGENTVIHNAAVTRMTQLGVVPVSWLSFASELQRTYDDADTVATYLDIQLQAPGFAKNLNTLAYVAAERAAEALSR